MGPVARSEAPSVTLAPTARSCSEGRRFVTQTLTDWGLLGLLDAAALLASEVITNAVLHARTVVTVTVVRTDPGTVRIDVSDGSPHAPERRQANEEDTNGRGIGLLDTLAASWSVRMTEHGKTLSFSLDEARDPWSAAMTTELWAAEL